MNIKVGDLYKHFKGKDLLEKNIYEILQVNVTYTGENANVPLENLVVYRNIFQKDKFFAREYNDLIEELSEEKQKQYGQRHRIEKLTEEEIKIIKDEEFKNEKLKYIENQR